MKKRWILAGTMSLVCVSFLLAGIYRKQTEDKKRKEDSGTVRTVQVTRQNLIDSIGVTGTVESADSRDVSATAKNVKVLEVRYQEGDFVEKGDVVVVLDSSDLKRRLQQEENNQKLSEYKENKLIETAEEGYRDVVSDGTEEYNQAVKQETAAKEALQESGGKLSKAAETLKRREARVAEAEKALKQAGEEEKTDMETALQEAKASYTEAHQEYMALEEEEKRAQETYQTASEALKRAEEKNARSIKTAADQLEQAKKEHAYSNDSSQEQIEDNKNQIDSCMVAAPVSGVITAMKVAEGDTYMGESNLLFTVADKDHFVISAAVSEYEVANISREMKAAVLVEAAGSEEIPAEVSYVSPTAEKAEEGNASYKVRIALEGEQDRLRAGMTAKASIIREAVYDVLTVPYDCVTTDEDGNTVIYADDNGEKTKIPVTEGKKSGYYVEISGDGVDENTMVYYMTELKDDMPSEEEQEDFNFGDSFYEEEL